jgi:cysteine sulfinate desulfinase/cysteine desulfurase-like protein
MPSVTYLDNNATTAVATEVMKPCFRICAWIGNPSSMHDFEGTWQEIDRAREQLARLGAH